MNKSHHLRYGLVISAILILLSTVYYIFNLQEVKWTSWINDLIMFIGIIITCIHFSKLNNKNVTFGNVFANGFRAATVIALLTSLFSVALILFFPDIKEKALQEARIEMEKQGQPEEVIEKAIAITSKMFIVFMLGANILRTLFYGVVAALVGAVITKKKNTEPPVSF